MEIKPEKPVKFDSLPKPITKTDVTIWESTLWLYLKSHKDFRSKHTKSGRAFKTEVKEEEETSQSSDEEEENAEDTMANLLQQLTTNSQQ